MLQSVETVHDLIRMVLLSVCLADVLVLGMALVFWIRSRIHEIGTLLALGIGKMQIIAQFAIETGLMAVVAALCSLGTGSLLSGYVSSLLLHDSGVAPLESLQVETLPPEQTLLILLLGCAVIAIALAVSCAAVLAKSPIHSFLYALGDINHDYLSAIGPCQLLIRRGEDPRSFGRERRFRIRKDVCDNRPIGSGKEHFAVSVGRSGCPPLMEWFVLRARI